MGLTWLKKVGEIAARGAAFATGLSPLVEPFFEHKGKSDDIFAQVNDSLMEAQNVITTVEAIGAITGIDGKQKLSAASPLIATILKNKLVAGRKIKDQPLFDAGVSGLTDSLVKILNSLDEGDAKID